MNRKRVEFQVAQSVAAGFETEVSFGSHGHFFTLPCHAAGFHGVPHLGRLEEICQGDGKGRQERSLGKG
jgi:hypothetical protein